MGPTQTARQAPKKMGNRIAILGREGVANTETLQGGLSCRLTLGGGGERDRRHNTRVGAKKNESTNEKGEHRGGFVAAPPCCSTGSAACNPACSAHSCSTPVVGEVRERQRVYIYRSHSTNMMISPPRSRRPGKSCLPPSCARALQRCEVVSPLSHQHPTPMQAPTSPASRRRLTMLVPELCLEIDHDVHVKSMC